MNIYEPDRYVSNLTDQAKSGDKESRKKLFEINVPLINRLSCSTFNEINRLYKKQNKSDLPDNIISADDVEQDFYIKSLKLLDNYLSKDINIYFSVYLNNMLVSYSKTYCKHTLGKILKIYDLEKDRNIDNRFQKMLDKKIDKELEQEIIEISSLDTYMSKYIKLLEVVFNYSNWKTIIQETGLSKRYISRRLDQYKELYKLRKDKIVNQNKVEELLKQVNDIKDYSFIELCTYYDVFIMKYVVSIYSQIYEIDSSFSSLITLENIKEQMIRYFYKCVLNYKSKKYSKVDNFDDYLYRMLRLYKIGYIKKFKYLLEENKTDKKFLKRKKLI